MKNKLWILPISLLLVSCNNNGNSNSNSNSSTIKPLEYDATITLNEKTNHVFKEKTFKEIPSDLKDSSGLTYELSEDKTYYIVSDANHGFTSTTLVIPETYNNLPVKEIASEGFGYRNWLNTVYIPKSITKIGDGAFNGTGLKTLYYDAVEANDFNAKNWVFYPSSTQSMDVYFGSNVKKIPNRMFYPLATNPSLVPHVNNIYFSKNSQIESIGDYAFYRLSNVKNLSLPDTITSIGNYAFYEWDVEEVTLPTSLSALGEWGFGNSTLAYVKFNNALTSLGSGAFYSNENLIEVDLSLTNIKEINKTTFFDCVSLSNLYFNDNITLIEKEAFKNCINLNKIILPNELVEVKESAFEGCVSLEQLKLNKKLKELGKGAFKDLTNVSKLVVESVALDDLSSGNKVFENLATNSKNAQVMFLDGVTSIPARMFFPSADVSLTPVIKQLILANSISNIGDYAFYDLSIESVDYLGSKSEFSKININTNNDILKTATMHKEDNK